MDAAILAVLVAVGFVLRWRYAAQGLWWDEYLVPYYASLSFEQFVRAFVAEEAHPPLYFMLTRLVVDRFGDAPSTLRALSVVVGLAQIPLSYALGRFFLGRRREALLGAALIACWPWHVEFSSHARMYTLFTLLASAATGAFGAFVGPATGRTRVAWGCAYALFTGLGLLTHYYMVLVVAAHAFWYVAARAWRSAPPVAVLAAWLGAAVIFYPWFWVSNILPSSPTFGGALTPWVPVRGLGQVLATLETALGRSYSPWRIVPIVAFVLAVALHALWKRRSARPWLLLSWTLVPPLLLGGVSMVLALTHGSPVYQPRQLIFVLPAVLLLVAAAVGEMQSRSARALLAVGLISMALAAPIARKPVLEHVVETLEQQAQATDVVLVFPVLSYQVLAHYARGTPARDVPILPLVDFQDTEDSVRRRVRAIVERAERVWIIERHLEDFALAENGPAMHAAALEALEATMTRDRAWIHLGSVPWQISRYVPTSEVGPPQKSTRVQVELPEIPFSRQTLLIVAEPDPASPTRFPSQPPRWFGTATSLMAAGYGAAQQAVESARVFGESLGEVADRHRTTVNIPTDGRLRVLVVMASLGPLQWTESSLSVGFPWGKAPREVTIRQAEQYPPAWGMGWAQLAGAVTLLLGLLVELLTRKSVPGSRSRLPWLRWWSRPVRQRVAVVVAVALTVAIVERDSFRALTFARLGHRSGPSPEQLLARRTIWGEAPAPMLGEAQAPGRRLAWLRFGPAGLVGMEPYDAELLGRILERVDGDSPFELLTVRGEAFEDVERDPDLLVIEVDVARAAKDLLDDDWEQADTASVAPEGPRVIVAAAGAQPGKRMLESRFARARVLELTVPEADRAIADPDLDPCAPALGVVGRLVTVVGAALEGGLLEAQAMPGLERQLEAGPIALSSLQPMVETTGHGPLGQDAFRESLPLMLGGERYARGLDAHAPSCGIWWLGQDYRRLVGRAGLWDSGNAERGVPGDFAGERGEVRFEILVDGRVAWRSSVRHWNDPPVQFDVALDGARVLALRVLSEGSLEYDWSIWADVWLELAALPASGSR